jgi:hypothetical protein
MNEFSIGRGEGDSTPAATTAVAAAGVRCSTAGRSARAITAHVMSPIITMAAAPPPAVTPPPAAPAIISTAAHKTNAPGQPGQGRNGQPQPDPATPTDRNIQNRSLFGFHN